LLKVLGYEPVFQRVYALKKDREAIREASKIGIEVILRNAGSRAVFLPDFGNRQLYHSLDSHVPDDGPYRTR
jgi:hypothetical protein